MVAAGTNLQELTETVVGGLLGGTACVALAGETAGKDELCAGVAMSGAWNGTLVVRSSPDAVRRAAQIMLSVALDRPTSDDLRDFLGEIANVMARSMKAVLPGVETSLPFPMLGAVSGKAATQGSGVRLDLAGEPMVVELIAKGTSFAPKSDGRAT